MGMDWEGDSEDSFLDTPALEPRIKQNVCKTDFLSKNIGAFDVFLHEFENVRDVGFHFLLFFLIFGEEQIDWVKGWYELGNNILDEPSHFKTFEGVLGDQLDASLPALCEVPAQQITFR